MATRFQTHRKTILHGLTNDHYCNSNLGPDNIIEPTHFSPPLWESCYGKSVVSNCIPQLILHTLIFQDYKKNPFHLVILGKTLNFVY